MITRLTVFAIANSNRGTPPNHVGTTVLSFGIQLQLGVMKFPWKVLGLAPVSALLVGLTGCDSVLQAMGLRTDQTIAETSATTDSTIGSQTLMTEGDRRVLANAEVGIELTLPASWSAASGLNKAAALQARDEANDLYIIVVAEDDATLQQSGVRDNAQRYRDLLIRRLQANGQFEGSVSTNVDFIGEDYANQSEIRGQLADGTPVVYLHTTVSTANRYYQIVAWTTPDQYSVFASELQRITETFQEDLPN